MKLNELFDYKNTTILNETRVANQHDIIDYLQGVASHLNQKPNSYKFMTDQIYKILSKDSSNYVPYRPSQGYKTEYDRKDAENGTLVKLHLSPSTCEKIRHLADWLRDAPDQTNLRGVQSLDIANQMADAYFAKKNRQTDTQEDLSGIKPVFRDGPYLWVQVLSQQALNREGKLMQHCVGSYAERVAQDDCQIYSLRDKNNQPHCTIEVTIDGIKQIKGKQNRQVIEKYWDTCKNFINHMKFKLSNNNDLRNIGLIEVVGNLVSLDEFQQMDNVLFRGNLSLSGCTGLTGLPKNLSVKGNLILDNCTGLTELPDNLSVGGTLYLNNCTGLTRLPDNLSVGKMLSLSGCTGLTELPENLSVKGNLDLFGCTGLTRLPENLSVGKILSLSGCTGLTELPENLSVGGTLYLNNCTGLTELPDNLSVGGTLYLNNCTGLTRLPDNLSVGEGLVLYECNSITRLPKNMKIGHKIHGFSGNKAEYRQYKFGYT